MKLIHYVTKRYIIYSAVISLVAIPLFYISLQHLLLKSLDEGMRHQKKWIEKKMNKISSRDFVAYENNISVTPSKIKKRSDSFSSELIFIKEDNEIVMHRILISNIVADGKYYTVRIQKSMIEDEDLLQNLLFLQFAFMLILLIGLGLINFFLSKKIWLPFNDIVEKMKNYRVDISGKLNFMPTAITEFKDMETSITELVERNNKLYKSQKEFTENASHELQTPIAVFHSKLELLMQTHPISEEQAGLIEEIFLSGEKMQRINRTLLLLTKIENNQFPNIEKIEVGKVFKHLIKQHQEMLLDKTIRVEMLPQEEVEIAANPILIDILFGNLLSNAFKYTEDKKRIKVAVANQSVIVSNESANGKGKLNEPDLFQRFKKQSNDSRSLGLGLEICKKISDLYHFNIVYDFADNQHSFIIYFK